MGLFSTTRIENEEVEKEVEEEEEWMIKRIHQATFGAKSTLAGLFFVVIVKEEKNEDEEKEKEVQICKSCQTKYSQHQK
jgi:hypothetical protein